MGAQMEPSRASLYIGCLSSIYRLRLKPPGDCRGCYSTTVFRHGKAFLSMKEDFYRHVRANGASHVPMNPEPCHSAFRAPELHARRGINVRSGSVAWLCDKAFVPMKGGQGHRQYRARPARVSGRPHKDAPYPTRVTRVLL